MLTQAELFDAAPPAQAGVPTVQSAPPPRPQATPPAERLWLSLHLPQLPLEVFPHFEPEDPVVVTEPAGPRLLVVAASQAAADAGVTPGMTASAAQALCLGLQAVPRDTGVEDRRLRWLARWASRFSSWVSVQPPCTLVLEVAGSQRLFGSPRELQRSLRAGLGAHGHQARTAVAPTARAAGWLATWSDTAHPLAETADAARAAVVALPIAALDLPPRKAQRMTRAGLRTLGDVLRLPRDGLARRYGRRVVEQLDQATGQAPEALPTFAAPQRFATDVDLPLPSAATPRILAAAEHALARLCDYLRTHDRAVDRLRCRLFHDRAPATVCMVGLRSAGRDPARLARLLDEHLSRMTLPEDVVALRIEAPRLLPMPAGNADWLDNSGTDDWLATVERWQARLGPAAVRRLGTHADHRPERASTVNAHDANTWPTQARPVYLLDHPQAMQVHGNRPVRGGPLRRLAGPERIEQGWWDGADISRDYYILCDARGARLWAFQDRQRLGWWLQGVFA